MPITYYVALPFVLSEESELIPGEAKDFQSSGPENLRHRAPLKLGDLVNKKNSGQIGLASASIWGMSINCCGEQW